MTHLSMDFRSSLLIYSTRCQPQEQAHFYHFHLLLWRFNGLWAWLLNLQKWDISYWTPLMKEETFNNPCENVFFVIEYDLEEDRDSILTLGHWFWGSWIPTFDPVMESLASAHVWVMILNMLFHFEKR